MKRPFSLGTKFSPTCAASNTIAKASPRTIRGRRARSRSWRHLPISAVPGKRSATRAPTRAKPYQTTLLQATMAARRFGTSLAQCFFRSDNFATLPKCDRGVANVSLAGPLSARRGEATWRYAPPADDPFLKRLSTRSLSGELGRRAPCEGYRTLDVSNGGNSMVVASGLAERQGSYIARHKWHAESANAALSPLAASKGRMNFDA
jgi:hypothetical protein